MADIYLSRARTQLGGARLLAVKQIRRELSDDPAFLKMLVSEAKLAVRLSHANIVQVVDLGMENERLFIAMEYVEGFDLHDLLRRLARNRIRLPVEFALLIAREVVAALDYAHRVRDDRHGPLGIVHRDVSPSNVLVSFEGEIKLCDFGIARALHAGRDGEIDESRMRRVRVMGKSAYMSPEHARGDALDARADVFAAGILLWELCAGRRMYRGTDLEMLEQARDGRVPPLPNRGLPEHETLAAIVGRALAVDVDQRWQSAAEMLRALDDYIVKAKVVASQIRFGAFLMEHFGERILEVRRERERAARAIDDTPPGIRIPLDREAGLTTSGERPVFSREDLARAAETTARFGSVSASAAANALRPPPPGAIPLSQIVPAKPARQLFWALVVLAAVAIFAASALVTYLLIR